MTATVAHLEHRVALAAKRWLHGPEGGLNEQAAASVALRAATERLERAEREVPAKQAGEEKSRYAS